MSMVGALVRMGAATGESVVRAQSLYRMAATAVAEKATPAAMNDRMNDKRRGESWMLSLTGPNRIGIVRDMVKGVAAHGGNVEESRMATLGGEFAIISRVTVEAARAEEMIAAVRLSFPDHDLHAKQTSLRMPPPADYKSFSLHLEGPDSVGIVSMLTETLAKAGVNIHDMETEVLPAPFAGYPVFQLKADLTMPSTAVDSLAANVKKVEDKFGMTAEITDSTSKE